MNLLLPFSIGFGYPWIVALGSLTSAAFLYKVYKRNPSNKVKIVPTLFLLQQFKSDNRRAKSFFPPFRVFLEVLLLTLLIFLIGAIYSKDESISVALVVDNSLSMLTQSGGGGENYWELSKREVKSIIEALPSQAKISIFPAQGEASQDLNRTEAKAFLKQLKVKYTEDRLESRISQVAKQKEWKRIVIISDRPPRQPTPKVQYLIVGKTTNNIAIRDGQLSRDKKLLNVRIRAYIEKEAQVNLAAYLIQVDDKNGRGKKIGTRDLLVKSDRVTDTTIKIDDSDLSGSVGVVIELISKDSKKTDRLKEDNYWYIPFKEDKVLRRIGLISSFSSKQLNLDNLTGYEIVSLKKDIEGKDLDGFIYHRASIDVLPQKPALIVLPDTNSNALSSKKITTPTKITYWNKRSPVTRYLSPDSFGALKDVMNIGLPPEGTSIIRSPEGNLAWQADTKWGRIAVSGIELFPYEGLETLESSLLLLNLLNFVFQPKQDLLYQVPQDDGGITGALFNGELWQTLPGSSKDLRANYGPGLLTFTDSSANKKYMGLNYYSDFESNLLKESPVNLSQFKVGNSDINDKPNSFDLHWNLLVSVLCLLILEAVLELARIC